MIITPAILTDQLQTVQDEVNRILQFSPKATAVQVDIIDGEYADNLTIEAASLQEITFQNLAVDLHLITIEPGHILPELQGIANLRTVIAQVERMSSIPEFIAAVKEDLKCQVGLSLDLFTTIEALEEDLENVADEISVIQIMGNHAGSQGQELHPTALQTLRGVVEYRQKHHLNWEISVDVGMKPETIAEVKKIGATEVIVGSYLQGDQAPERWQALQQI